MNTLFDVSEYVTTRANGQPTVLDALDQRLRDYAFLYTGTAKGNYSGIRFMLTTEQAKQWCSSDMSRGVLYGTEWAYFFTTVWQFVQVYGQPIDLGGLEDNGQWDERLESLGLEKIALDEIAAVLRKYGVEITGNPRVKRKSTMPDAPLRATREEAIADEILYRTGRTE
jgi:hypothetical protein